MANQPQNFNTEMRKASNPDKPPGSSRAVHGKPPGTAASATVQATGFMAVEHVDPVDQEYSTEDSPERNLPDDLVVSESPPLSPNDA